MKAMSCFDLQFVVVDVYCSFDLLWFLSVYWCFVHFIT